MNVKQLLKLMAVNIPASLGSNLSIIPFQTRLGGVYKSYKNKAQQESNSKTMFSDVKELVRFAEITIPFYSDFYKNNDFSYAKLNTFDDLKNIPILTKSDLQKYDFDKRTSSLCQGIITNTGGTSGQPLKLFLDKNAHAREWAHMHTIWEKLGYKTSSIKLTIRGMNLGSKSLRYNFIHNEFQVNAYCDFELVVNALDKVLNTYRVEYLHGYPSGIYEFLKQLEEQYPQVLKNLMTNLKGVFFGSEYPAPIYRNYIENLLSVPTISWYGHTEMAVLAYEKKEPFVYHPFQSYGFTEAVEIDGKQHLVGTTIHNKIGPLIRYDTGDIIEPISYKNGMLESFKVSEGRVGEFVTDKNGRKISLTALIFGRHHDIFGEADFVQIMQDKPGYLTVYITSLKRDLDCASLFDASGINMEISFEIISAPFKTPAGKIPLIVKG